MVTLNKPIFVIQRFRKITFTVQNTELANLIAPSLNWSMYTNTTGNYLCLNIHHARVREEATSQLHWIIIERFTSLPKNIRWYILNMCPLNGRKCRKNQPRCWKDFVDEKKHGFLRWELNSLSDDVHKLCNCWKKKNKTPFHCQNYR